MMLRRALSFVLAVLAAGLVVGGPARAGRDCPIEPFDLEKIEKAIEAEASCKAAYDLMNACRTNAGGDVGLANVVIAKCEKGFVTRGQSPRMKAYAEERAVCARKYANKQGTMYASFQATCEAGVAVKFAR